MKKRYLISWDRNDYGRVEIDAENETEARKKFEQGDYSDKDLTIKGGEMSLVDIEETIHPDDIPF